MNSWQVRQKRLTIDGTLGRRKGQAFKGCGKGDASKRRGTVEKRLTSCGGGVNSSRLGGNGGESRVRSLAGGAVSKRKKKKKKGPAGEGGKLESLHS